MGEGILKEFRGAAVATASRGEEPHPQPLSAREGSGYFRLRRPFRKVRRGENIKQTFPFPLLVEHHVLLEKPALQAVRQLLALSFQTENALFHLAQGLFFFFDKSLLLLFDAMELRFHKLTLFHQTCIVLGRHIPLQPQHVAQGLGFLHLILTLFL